MPKSCLATTAFVAALAFAAPADAFLAKNGLVVEPSGSQFDVPYRGQSGARAFWCAAADYAVHALGAKPATRIWRMSEPPRRSGEGITFSLSSEGAAQSTGLAIFGGRGASLTVAHADLLCEPLSILD